mmetsp:Transcript_2635/g.3465  ORF Transcript_2635/g.3465 Transcript_2635/m.3465 type:complete len:236 (-) Transcript_2635:128-835(-)
MLIHNPLLPKPHQHRHQRPNRPNRRHRILHQLKPQRSIHRPVKIFHRQTLQNRTRQTHLQRRRRLATPTQREKPPTEQIQKIFAPRNALPVFSHFFLGIVAAVAEETGNKEGANVDSVVFGCDAGIGDGEEGVDEGCAFRGVLSEGGVYLVFYLGEGGVCGGDGDGHSLGEEEGGESLGEFFFCRAGFSLEEDGFGEDCGDGGEGFGRLAGFDYLGSEFSAYLLPHVFILQSTLD